MTIKEIISKLKHAVGIENWDLVMEMIEELEIKQREDEDYEFPDYEDWDE